MVCHIVHSREHAQRRHTPDDGVQDAHDHAWKPPATDVLRNGHLAVDCAGSTVTQGTPTSANERRRKARTWPWCSAAD